MGVSRSATRRRGSRVGESPPIITFSTVSEVIYCDPCARTGPAAESPMPETVEVKPYDWTYTPVYPGHASVPPSLDNDGFRPADPENPRHEIPIAELQRPDPILFYAELPLYEDELHDNGLSALTIRIVSTTPACLVTKSEYAALYVARDAWISIRSFEIYASRGRCAVPQL